MLNRCASPASRPKADLFAEATKLRDRIAEIRNDVAAVDRVLGTLGYAGDLDAAMPGRKRQVQFGTGELTRGCLEALPDATAPLTRREIAQTILSVVGQAAGDRRLMTEHTRRISKAPRKFEIDGVVSAPLRPRVRMVWELRHDG